MKTRNELIQENQKLKKKNEELKFQNKQLEWKCHSLNGRNKQLEEDLRSLRPFGMHVYSLNNNPDKISMPYAPYITIPCRASVEVGKDNDHFSWRIVSYLDKPDYLTHHYYLSDMELLSAKDRVGILEHVYRDTMMAFYEKLK